jgi:hypothetical protein
MTSRRAFLGSVGTAVAGVLAHGVSRAGFRRHHRGRPLRSCQPRLACSCAPVTDSGPKRALKLQRLSDLTREDLIRLADETPPWPYEVERRLSGLPIELQYLSDHITAWTRGSSWTIWNDTPQLFNGAMLQIYNGDGYYSYNSGGNTVDWFGQDTVSHAYGDAEGGFPCQGCNAWALYAAGATHYFHNDKQGMGYGPGVLTQFFPDWGLHWSIGADDAGPIRTIVNDSYYDDNDYGYLGADYVLRSAATWYKHLLMTKFKKA